MSAGTHSSSDGFMNPISEITAVLTHLVLQGASVWPLPPAGYSDFLCGNSGSPKTKLEAANLLES